MLEAPHSGNPILQGWYADPGGHVFGDATGSIRPTPRRTTSSSTSTRSRRRTWFTGRSTSASSTTGRVRWARRAMWAPSIVERNGKYYLFFGANDMHEGEIGGIGVAVGRSAGGTVRGLSGQAADRPDSQRRAADRPVRVQGQRRPVLPDLRRLAPLQHREAQARTSPGFVPIRGRHDVQGDHAEGLRRRRLHVHRRTASTTSCGRKAAGPGRTTAVAYAIGDSPFGPFERIGKILQQDPSVATGAGHHSVLQRPRHRRVVHRLSPPAAWTRRTRNHRVICIDRMEFDAQGLIKPVRITHTGVARRPL